MNNIRLGKLPPKHDHRTLMMASYLQPSILPALPMFQFWEKEDAYAMYDNDTLGDCTIAGAANLMGGWSECSKGTPNKFTNDQIIYTYSILSGYNPQSGDGADNGCVELDVLKYWKNTGIANHKIDAFMGLEPGNDIHLKSSVYLFGGAYLGLALPLSAQNQDIWSIPVVDSAYSQPGSWGGHCVIMVGYDPMYAYLTTWGAVKKATWGFLDKYIEEAYAIMSPDWLNSNNVAPNHFDTNTLNKDLRQL